MRDARTLAAAALLACPAASQAREPNAALTTLGLWLDAYRGGSVPLERADDAPAPVATSRSSNVNTSWAATSLEEMVSNVVDVGTADAAQLLLAVSAVGLDRRRYQHSLPAAQVRMIGEGGVWRLDTKAARAAVLQTARGETGKSTEDVDVALQAAALRALGNYRNPVFRPTLEQHLSSHRVQLRLAAATGLYRMRSLASLAALLDALEQETEEPVIQTLAHALSELIEAERSSIWPPRLERAAAVAATRLERSTWRADLALIELLEATRHPRAVPALIDILEAYVSRRHKLTRSTRVSHRAYEVLVAWTDAHHPIGQPKSWRRTWKRADGKLPSLDQPGKVKPVPGPRCFGIPIQGSRVVFVVDLSGSMAYPLGSSTRLDVARRKLSNAIRRLPETTSFGVVTFARKARPWRRKLSIANSANKANAAAFVRNLEIEGGTNTWAALTSILDLQERAYGKTCPIKVDEMFLISDGIPTTGDLIDAQAILQLVDEGNEFDNVCIHTVSLAPEITVHDEAEEAKIGMRARDFMERLAQQNGGRFTDQF